MKNFVKEHTSFSIICVLVVSVAIAVALRNYVPMYMMVQSGVVVTGILASALVVYAVVQTVTAEQE